jgi:hypothetical protein
VPATNVVLYRELDGSCPFLEWFGELPAKAQDKRYLRLERLGEMGHELRRPKRTSYATEFSNSGSVFKDFITASYTSSMERAQRWSRTAL